MPTQLPTRKHTTFPTQATSTARAPINDTDLTEGKKTSGQPGAGLCASINRKSTFG